jgi:DNA-binding NarL/FixJ family response regulator
MTAPPIKVSLIEDNQPLATELEKWINDTQGLKCIASYPSAEEAVRLMPRTPPDIALVDLRLPGMSGVELIRKLKSSCPDVQCLVLTMYAETDLIFEALKAGACGYMLKVVKPAEMLDAIRQVHSGGSVMSPRIARQVLEMLTRSPAPSSPLAEDHRLTSREKEVLSYMAEGKARKQIAEDLLINTHTLDYVVRCIYRKLHVQSAAAAVSVAIRDGIVPPPH